MATDSIHLVQLTDLHLFAKPSKALLGVVTEESFQAVLAAVLPCRPDLILLTGDLSQDGSLASYRRLRQTMERIPSDIYWLAGNHDRLSAMEAELCGKGIHADKVFSRGNWCFVLLNSLMPGKDSGYLSDESLEQLHCALKTSADLGQHVLVSLHHPPFSVDSGWLDTSALQQPERLFQILDPFSHVRLVLFGHIHQDLRCQRRGVEYLASPSTCIQFRPQSQDFSLDVVPPAFRELWLHPDGRFASILRRIPAGLQMPNLQVNGY